MQLGTQCLALKTTD